MTTQTATIQIKIDPKLKSDAIKLFDDIGLNLSDAIKLFLKQSINSSSLPFEPMVSKSYFSPKQIADIEESLDRIDTNDTIKFDNNQKAFEIGRASCRERV